MADEDYGSDYRLSTTAVGLGLGLGGRFSRVIPQCILDNKCTQLASLVGCRWNLRVRGRVMGRGYV